MYYRAYRKPRKSPRENDSIHQVKHGKFEWDILKETYLGLWEHKEHNKQDYNQPNAIDDIILPAEILQSNGVDKLVEEAGTLDGSHEKSDSFGADIKGKDLDWIRNSQRVPANIVRRGEEDDTCEDSSASCF